MNNTKKEYVAPVVNVIYVDKDVITSSAPTVETPDQPWEPVF